MAELEVDRIAGEKTALRTERDRQQQIIKAAERYERLLANGDFREMLKDLEDVIKAHDYNIAVILSELEMADSPFKILRAAMVLKHHLILKSQTASAMRRPERIVEMGREAKAILDKIIERERELPNA